MPPAALPLEHQIVQAIWTGTTNVALLPTVFLTCRVGMQFESVISFFTFVTSTAYHVCESLKTPFLGFNHGRWHHMDNVFAITGLMVNIVNFAQAPRPSALREFRNALAASIVICAQLSSPWDLLHTVVPLALGFVLMVLEMVYLRRLPTLDRVDAVKALLCTLIAGLCFYKGLDERSDWLRLWHGGWHIGVGGVSYFSVRCQNPQLRKVTQKSE
mmetsp:Transcript_58696/g.109890  ORF Transcript_58696/g.109890 Transcript_58696/m.109890 type:complete len:215 (+) Transcript_58696:81-725(+)